MLVQVPFEKSRLMWHGFGGSFCAMQRCRFCALESGAVDHSRGEYGLWSVDPRAAEHMMPSPLGMVHAARDGMTMRDAFFQASLELGFSERTTERNLRAIQPVFPRHLDYAPV